MNQHLIKVKDSDYKLFDVEDGSMLDRLIHMKAGTRLTLIKHTIFGEPYEEKVSFAGAVQHHGYSHGSGSWSLYGSVAKGDLNCFEVLVRPYKKQHGRWTKLEYSVKEIKLGWE